MCSCHQHQGKIFKSVIQIIFHTLLVKDILQDSGSHNSGNSNPNKVVFIKRFDL